MGVDFLRIQLSWGVVMRKMHDNRFREIYEKKKNPENKKTSAPRQRSMISIVVAAVSFVISIISFYNSSLRQVDDVSVVLESNGRVSDERWTETQRGPTVKPQIHSGQDLIFINGGTRPLALVELTMAATLLDDSVEHDDEDDRTTCNGAGGTLLWTNFQPFVIKAGEIIPKHLQFSEGGALKDTVRLPAALVPSDTQAIRVCFRFGFATPDSGYEEVVLKRPPFHLTGTQNFWDGVRLDKVGHLPRRIVYWNRTTVGWLNRLLDWFARATDQAERLTIVGP